VSTADELAREFHAQLERERVKPADAVECARTFLGLVLDTFVTCAAQSEFIAPISTAKTPKKWYSVDEIAEYLSTTPGRVYQMVHEGTLHPHRRGRRLHFSLEEVDRSMDFKRPRRKRIAV